MTVDTRLVTTSIEVGSPGRKIAIKTRASRGDCNSKHAYGLFWLGGFLSDMEGTKALHVDDYAARSWLQCTRFDYSGHGISGGDFLEGTISRWREEAEAVLSITSGPQILIGSSMGAWIAMLMAVRAMKHNMKHISNKIAGMVLIAPAVDFTERILWPSLSQENKDELMRAGRFNLRFQGSDDDCVITQSLIEDGRLNLLMDGSIELGCPVYILQGVGDLEVPWRHAVLLLEHISCVDITLSLVQDGDHRLSRPSDLERLDKTIDAALCAAIRQE